MPKSSERGKYSRQSVWEVPRAFDNIFISMVSAGEMSGSLDTILLRLAEFTEARAELKAESNRQ